jgi:hypothetical protein
MHRPCQPFDEAPGCPSSCIFWLCWRRTFELPRTSRPFGSTVRRISGLPLLSAFQCRLSMSPQVSPVSASSSFCRRWIFEFPRISHPSAAPSDRSPGFPGSPLFQFRLSMRLRVSPSPASSGFADGEFPGCPESSLPRRVGLWISEFPRISHPPRSRRSSSGLPRLFDLPAPLSLEFSSCPESSLSPRCRRWISGFPRISHLPVFAVFASSSVPESCNYGWADDDSPA